MSTLENPDAVIRALTALNNGRFRLSTEAEAQEDIERALLSVFNPAQVTREARLSARDRPDFLISALPPAGAGCLSAEGGVVVEVKHNGATAGATLRQLRRYAEHAEVGSIILATGRAMDMPREIDGKRVFVVELGRSWL